MFSKKSVSHFSPGYRLILFGIGFLVLLAILVGMAEYYLQKTEVSVPPAGTPLQETGKMSASKNDFWWLNSGGVVYIDGNVISTIQGNLAKGSKWQKTYAKSNPRDTENGYQPQNILRLVTRQKFQNETQRLYFKINKLNFSASKFRNESNGVLLFNRYQNGNNLYYTGLRVDGDAVIKKKINGTYYTMKEKNLWTNGRRYDRTNNPDVLPLDAWIGIKSEVRNAADGSVDIKFYVDKDNNGQWQLVLEATDNGNKYGGAAIANTGYGGIRSDFMDVEFWDYGISELK
ncbi:MAG: hypothetical protein P4L62_03690 [Candidatus Pacebacteria bacterium]|nr:hypothetical protein [Candidatus Paceibacterota bacterium]MDR3583434.1 hypothetical protein [Candidatus Paceibacterota bacterium]